MKKEQLRIESLRKGILLERIHLQIFEGDIVHCVFDNLQEKKAFLEILTGREKADYGKVYYKEKRIQEEYVQQLFREKIAVVTKESNLIDSVTISENIFLIGSLVTDHWLNHKRFKKETSELFQEFGIDVNVKTSVQKLSVFEKLQIELLKAYLNGKKILVLTEICNLISDKEKKKLMKLLKMLRTRGISCVIMEPLEDIEFDVVSVVAIIRHGKTVLMKEAADCDYTILHKALYYNELKKRTQENWIFSECRDGSSIKIEDLTSNYLKHVDIKIKKGEILKIFCLDEKSYEELTDFFKGKIILSEGSITNDREKKKTMTSIQGLQYGIGITEGNPATATLFEELSVMDNIQILLSQKAKNVWLIPKYKKSIKMILKDVIPKNIFRKKVKDLSSSEVQKVLYSKWFLYSPTLLVCIQPFAEGNIEARETARKMIYLLKEREIPIIIITSNSAEFNYCIGREMYIQHGKNITKEQAYRILCEEVS